MMRNNRRGGKVQNFLTFLVALALGFYLTLWRFQHKHIPKRVRKLIGLSQ
jgi:hypothetical protein